MKSQSRLFVDKMLLNKKLSMHAYFGIGSIKYGLISWDGVCCPENLTKKSRTKIKGIKTNRNSHGVAILVPLAAKDKIIPRNIMYTIMNPLMI